MQQSLTLHVEEEVLEKARRYAESTGKSLTDVLQNYLAHLAEAATDEPLSPRLLRLYGALKLPTGMNEQDVLTDALLNKYLP